VVQAGLRGEAIALNRFTLPGRQDVPTIDEVIEVGLANRHDLMNARGVVMDARRALEVAANALKAKLDVNVSGSNRLHRGSNDTVDVSVDFKTPLDQVAERNDYNTALIAYQRARRTYMAAEDNIKRDIRIAWRALEVSQQRLEIDRQTARNAALEYDNVTISTRQDNLSLSRALNTVLRAENALVNDWVSYETNRLNIYRDMGIMQIDEDGVWDDEFYQRDVQPESSTLPDSTILAPELQPNIPFAPNPAPPANAPPDAVLNLPENPNQ
jgi:outer membrane protein TolC